MFNTYSSSNKDVTDLLRVWYEQEFVDTDKLQITRYARKGYRYIFMTSVAASDCIDAMKTKYTRQYAAWTVNDEDTIVQNSIYDLRTGIARSENTDGSFDVTISIDEQDVKIYEQSAFVANPSSYFTTENQRDYD